jgi:hypothetical protein
VPSGPLGSATKKTYYEHPASLKIVTYLLKHGADVNALNAYQNTPLHAACIEGLADCSKALLEAGADLQQPSGDMSNNATPLHLAAEYSHNRLVEMLLEKGADAKALDSNGKTPLELAMETVVSIGEFHQQRTVETLCNFLGRDVPSGMATARSVGVNGEEAETVESSSSADGAGGADVTSGRNDETNGATRAAEGGDNGDNPRPSEDIPGAQAADLALAAQALALEQREADADGSSRGDAAPLSQSGCGKCLIS